MNNNTDNEITMEHCSYICEIFFEFCDGLTDTALEKQILVNDSKMSDLEFEELLTKIDQAEIEESENKKTPEELKDLARNLRQYVTEQGIYAYLEGMYDDCIRIVKAECIQNFINKTAENIDIETLKSFILIKCHPSYTDEESYKESRDGIIENSVNADSQNLQKISDYFRHLNSRYTASDEQYAAMVHDAILGSILDLMNGGSELEG